MPSHFELARNPDSVEFLPERFPGLKSLLAVGTYTLQSSQAAEPRQDSGASFLGTQDASTKRVGTLELFEVGIVDEPEEVVSTELRHLLSHEVPAVLDLKWSPLSGAHARDLPLLAQAAADGCIWLHAIRESSAGDSPMVVDYVTHATASPEESEGAPLCLSLDWSISGNTPRIATSKSDGSLTVMEVGDGGSLKIVESWEAHGFEAWTCAFDRWRPEVLYSGGDDCSFCVWDTRTDLQSPTFKNRKAHAAGVTSIQCSLHKENLLVTGSYDEHIRFWDVRAVHRPVEECHVAAGGGVWRLKWHLEDPSLLLAACMHGGLAVVEMPRGGQPVIQDACPGHASCSIRHPDPSVKDSLLHSATPEDHPPENQCEEGVETLQRPRVMDMFMSTEKALIYGADWLPSFCHPEHSSRSPSSGSGVMGSGGKTAGSLAARYTAVGCSFYERKLEVHSIQK